MNVFKFKAKKKNLENEFKAYIIENKETFIFFSLLLPQSTIFTSP